MSFVNISSYSKHCLFILLMVSFVVKKLFNLTLPICVGLFLLPLSEVTDPRNSFLRLMCILPIFSPRSFVASHLVYKFLIYFKFIFLYSVRKWSRFISACSCPVFLTPFIEEAVLPSLPILASYPSPI